MPREVCVFEIGFVVRPRGEENDGRMIASRRREVEKHLALLAEEHAEALNIAIANFLAKNSRDDSPIFKCITNAAGGLSTIRQNPPLPIRCASEIAGVKMQINLRSDFNPAARTKESWIGIDQFGREKAIAKQELRA